MLFAATLFLALTAHPLDVEPPPAPAPAPSSHVEDSTHGPRTISVDCDRGGSIRRALIRTRRAHEVIVEIRGLCDEDVLIERDRVTLRGGDPATDGIRGMGTLPNTVLIRRAVFQVTLENLRLVGADEGPSGVGAALGVDGGFLLQVRGARLEARRLGAIVAQGGNIGFEDTRITTTEGGTALHVTSAARAACSRCELEAAGGRAVVATGGSRLRLFDSQLSGRTGVRITEGATVSLEEGDTAAGNTVTAEDGGLSVSLARQATLFMDGGTLDGPFSASSRSTIQLIDVQQTISVAAPAGNRAGSGSIFLAGGTAVLDRSVDLDGFSRAIFNGNVTIQGPLSCDPGSDATCIGLTATGSSCGLCTLP